FIWEHTRATGLSRRQILKLLATGAGAAALGLSPRLSRPAAAQAPPAIIKPTPPDQFIRFPTNAEMLWEVMADEGYTTPNANFFVRNPPFTPLVDQSTWRLRVDGSGVNAPLELTYDDIRDMPAVTVKRFVECAGNGRTFFATQQGHAAAPGTQWRLGAGRGAEWAGVPLWRGPPPRGPRGGRAGRCGAGGRPRGA